MPPNQPIPENLVNTLNMLSSMPSNNQITPFSGNGNIMSNHQGHQMLTNAHTFGPNPMTQPTNINQGVQQPIQVPQQIQTQFQPQFQQTQQSMQPPIQQQQQASNSFSTGFLGQASVDPCNQNPCLNEGTCVSNGNSFTCKCPWGWNGARCEICVTSCASNPCPSNRRCKAKFEGGYDCVCPPNKTGTNCELVNDVCASNPCRNGGVCTPIEGGTYTCQCSKPWSGVQCDQVWQNPCTEEVLRRSEVTQFPNPWNRRGFLICIDVNIYHEMACSVGTYFNPNLHHCVPEGYEPPVCTANYCFNDGECLLDQYNVLKCLCKKGFNGDRCENNINECEIEGGNQACQGGTCVDQVNGFYCQCANGQIGVNCQSTIANPCTEATYEAGNNFYEVPSSKQNVYLQCTGENRFTVSRCAENLYWHSEERTCTVEKPPVKYGSCLSYPCKNAGECQEDGAYGFRCVCKTGYTGKTCEHMIDYCESGPCQNGGKCLPYAGGYTCLCEDKVVDDCCCHGVLNPCPAKNKLVPGLNNYYPHVLPNRYIHCDFEGRAFVKTCAPTTRWDQNYLTCAKEFRTQYSSNYVPESYGQVYAQPAAPQQPYNQPSYQQQQQSYEQPQNQKPIPAIQPPEQSPSQSVYEQPTSAAEPVVYEQPATSAPLTYEQPDSQQNYGQPEAPAQEPYQPPVQEATTEESPVQAHSYEQPSQPSYQQPAQPQSYQQPAQPQSYQQPAQPESYQQPAQPESYQQPSSPISQSYQQNSYEQTRKLSLSGTSLSPKQISEMIKNGVRSPFIEQLYAQRVIPQRAHF
jgi:hypothetical protein